MRRVLGVMVTVYGDEEPRVFCGGCASRIERARNGRARREATYYYTSYTYDLMAGKNCGRCYRSLGEVAAAPTAVAAPTPPHPAPR